MKKALSFDDVLLVPSDFSYVRSRQYVSTYEVLAGKHYDIPIVASNMTSVYSSNLAREVAKAGGVAAVPRFCTIKENIDFFENGTLSLHGKSDIKPWVSVGVSTSEFERAEALVDAGAEVVLIDLANGASIQAVEQFNRLKEAFKDNISVVVGNFATSGQMKAFVHHAGQAPRLFKVGIGPGSSCSTRVVTGAGLPSFTTVQDCASTGYDVLADGGMKNSGDVAKALAAGAKGVMLGRLFAGCEESGAESIYERVLTEDRWGQTIEQNIIKGKEYKGSASLSSYRDQGKEASFRAPEGASYTIPISGTVRQLMNTLSGGLRSSMSYLDAFNLDEFRAKAQFVEVTNSGIIEGTPFGKNL